MAATQDTDTDTDEYEDGIVQVTRQIREMDEYDDIDHPTGRPKSERLSVENRFWNKVDIGEPDECWEWTASTGGGGYGQIKIGKNRRAHRVSYQMAEAPIPEGKQINHHCDNPICVNPDHLYSGTSAQNARDMVERERNKKQLPLDTVREIRARYDEEDITQGELADEHNVDQSTISRITNEQRYDFID